jgi:hypothetical protein
MTEATFAVRFLAAACAILCVLGGFRFVAHVVLQRGLRGAVGGVARGRALALLETLYLPNAAALHLIRAGDRVVLIGRSGAHIAAICDVPTEKDGAARSLPEG